MDFTEDEAEYLTSVIRDMLDPVESLKSDIYSVEGKHVCLSGNFAYGQKSDVEQYIVQRGGTVVSGVNKKVDILIISNN